MFFLREKIFKLNKVTGSILLLILLLISPLIIQSVPLGGFFTYLTLFFFLCLFFIINFKKFLTCFTKPSLPIIVFFLYLFSFFIGICITGSETPIFVLKEFIWGCFLFLTLCCANIYYSQINALKIFEKFFSNIAVVLVGLISLFAYLKFLTLNDGYIIDFLLNGLALEQYPKGTALVGDVNFFSLTILICSFLAFSLWRRSSALTKNILWMAVFILLIVIGFLAGSRRFFLLSIILLPTLLFLTIKFDENLVFKRLKSIILACSIIFGAGFFVNRIPNIADYLAIFSFDLSPATDVMFDYSERYLTLLNGIGSYGFEPRIVRWSYGMDLIDLKTILIGDGFDYIRKFSCNFNNCRFVDYPHAPMLSSILYGGIFGLLSYLTLISFLIFICFKLLFFSKLYFEWGIALLCTILFTTISGNSLLSMPVLFSVTTVSYAVYKIEFAESDYAVAKRLFDISISSLALLLFMPVFILLCLAIFSIAGRPIFFCQSRPGLNCVTFKMYKFRSMHNIKQKDGYLLPDKDRLLPLGSFFRSTSLDELPELWNVLIGDMSLVGPRPLLKEYLPLYSSNQLRRHEVRPGITGWAQINGRNSIEWDKKFELDIWYLENMSFWLDIKILVKTFMKVIKREGSISEGEATAKPFKGND